MACETTLVIEYDETGKRVAWDLHCSGKCPGGGECKRRRIPDGANRWRFECACKQEGDGDPESGTCKLIVIEHQTETGATFKGMCLGHCPGSTTPCRPVVVKEYKLAPVDDGGFFDMDHMGVHTIRHFKCVCADELI